MFPVEGREKLDNETCSRKHCCRGKTIIIARCECLLVIQHVMRMRRYYILKCGLSGCAVFFNIIS